MCANHDSLASTPSRRGFLFTLGLALSGLAAALAGIPIVGYIFGPVRGRAGQAWIKLGSAGSFPEGETRLATDQNPFRVPWGGPPAEIACLVRRIGGDPVPGVAVHLAPLRLPRPSVH